MNVLILGSGGREHALAWKIVQSDSLEKLFVAPGNPGTALHARNVKLNPLDFDQVERFCREEDIRLLIVGPEEPLVRGIKDHFRNSDTGKTCRVIGPDSTAAQLEGSKEFSKKFMKDYGIPTASYQSFGRNDLTAAKSFLHSMQPPFVLKADGLAAGKGVVIQNHLEAAEVEMEEMLNGKFGEASKRVVVEEFLKGREFSVFVITDGRHYKILPVAKDYKRIGEADTGLNTGGMGAVSPVPFVDDELMQKVNDRIIQPTITGIVDRNMDYTGFIFFGLIEVDGNPFVIEYNVRMGDPETEVVMPRLKSDLLQILMAAVGGGLEEAELELDERYAATVMTVSGGYPGKYEKGKEISGLENVKESIAFHAGTSSADGKLFTNGGRVLAFTSYGKSAKDALKNSYASVKKVCFEGITFRKDIGFDL